MKTARIVVRAKVHKSSSNELYDDAGLEALESIYRSPYEEFPDDMNDSTITKFLVNKYIDNFVKFIDFTVQFEQIK